MLALGRLGLLSSSTLARSRSGSFQATSLLIQGWALPFGCPLLCTPITTIIPLSDRDILHANKEEVVSLSTLHLLLNYIILVTLIFSFGHSFNF